MNTPIDQALLRLLQDGLPLTERPYAALAEELQVSEQQLVERLRTLAEEQLVRRLGIVVRHRRLGYRANAMVVWDIPDNAVDTVAKRLAAQQAVSLCYQRPRRLPDWPYNLFCMIHGRERQVVLQSLAEMVEQLDLSAYRHDVLFSTRCFKQRGGRYIPPAGADEPPVVPLTPTQHTSLYTKDRAHG